jgi:hypothetical protein
MASRLLPLWAEHFDLPDEELGKLILGLWIMDRAEGAGLDLLNIPQEASRILVKATQELPDDHVSSELDSLFLAVRLAANGKFEAAGKKLKSYADQRANYMAAMDMILNMNEDTRRGAKVRIGAKRGHESVHGDAVEKETRRREYLSLLAEIRNDNPKAKPRKVYELAEAQSEKRFGEKVSYKTFERAEKKENS